MVVSSDKWLGWHEKICVRFMKIYGQSTKFLWFQRNLKICEICVICVPNKFLWFPWFLCDKYLFICENFCTFVQPKNIYIYATKFYYIIRSCGACAEVLPLHPAAVSLVEVEVTDGRRSRFGTFVETEAPHLPPLWSRQYLRLSRPSLTARPSSPLGRSGEVMTQKCQTPSMLQTK